MSNDGRPLRLILADESDPELTAVLANASTEQALELDDDHSDVDEDEDDGAPIGRLIRPYAITGGRTGADGPEIRLESQVFATSRAAERRSTYRWETARLIDLVDTPMALVEVAARLEIPIGVARVLVADLVADGTVAVHETATSQSFTSLLEKVLDGVRQL